MQDELISKQAVLDLAKKGVLVSNGNYKSVCKAINELPSVNPQEPKTGHWIESPYETLRKLGYYVCSECGKGFKRFDRGIRKSDIPYIDGQPFELKKVSNYCPNCGARMESEE